MGITSMKERQMTAAAGHMGRPRVGVQRRLSMTSAIRGTDCVASRINTAQVQSRDSISVAFFRRALSMLYTRSTLTWPFFHEQQRMAMGESTPMRSSMIS